MYNIRKFCVQNKYTSPENLSKYEYIISKVYYLPFKKNIEKNIDKEVDKIFKWILFIKNLITILKSNEVSISKIEVWF